MSYRLDNDSYSRYNGGRGPGFRLGPILAVLLVLGLGGSWLFGLFDGVSGLVGYPFWRAGNQVAAVAKVAPLSLKSKRTLMTEHQELTARIDRLNLALQQQKTVQADNLKLREILGRTEHQAKPIVARVITKPYQTPYDVLVIDIGRENTKHLAVGDRVMAEGIMLGRVAEINAQTAKVRLLSSPGVMTAVFFNPSGVPAFAHGLGGSNFLIKLPRGTEIAKDETIIEASSTAAMIGKVGIIDTNPNNPFEIIRFRSPFNLFNIMWVEIYAA